MNVFIYVVLFVNLWLPLFAEEHVLPKLSAEWANAVRQAQQQLNEGRLAEALDSGRHSLQIARRSGSDGQLANSYFLLGSIQRAWAHCAESRTNFILAIATLRRQAGADVHHIFNAEITLITGLCECGDFDAAGKAFRTYEPDLMKYASGSIEQASLLSMKAAILFGRRKYAEAERLLLKAIALEKSPAASSIQFAIDRSTLSTIYERERRYTEALAQAESAIEFFEHSAPHHPSMVASLNNAACILARMGRNEESGRYFRRALLISQDLYSDSNRVSIAIMRSYAHVLQTNNQPQAAAEWQKRSAEATRRSAAGQVKTVDAEELRAIGR